MSAGNHRPPAIQASELPVIQRPQVGHRSRRRAAAPRKKAAAPAISPRLGRPMVTAACSLPSLPRVPGPFDAVDRRRSQVFVLAGETSKIAPRGFVLAKAELRHDSARIRTREAELRHDSARIRTREAELRHDSARIRTREG